MMSEHGATVSNPELVAPIKISTTSATISSPAMVSTRSVRYKYTEGERVLCYEPDPTKAKVLYDSKVLEVIESKDKRGRRSVEYLIHFQGWNSSWDRCVSEDFVLKDTEENRQLQRDLAEKSQLQLGAYLYRRERKKGGSSLTGPGAAKRRPGFSDDGSSSSTPLEEETGDTDSSLGSGGSSKTPSSPPHALIGRASITLPSALRDRLTFDYHLIVKRGRLSLLPASPSVAEILESFVKWFARSGAWRPARGRAGNEPPHRPNLHDVCCRLNLVREVADGLRVYFDFILGSHLLYKHEAHQYQKVCSTYIESRDIKVEPNESGFDVSSVLEEAALAVAESEMKSPRIPEYAHLPPDPVDFSLSPPPPVNQRPSAAKSEVNKTDSKPSQEKPPPADELNISAKIKPMDRCTTRSGNLARRLRSQKSGVSQSETEEPAPSTSTGEPRTIENLSSSIGSSGSSISSGWIGGRAPVAAVSTQSTRTPLSLLMDKVAKWEIIPRKGTEQLPCRVYGAIHLARLFVKLPDFLNATQIPDTKLKMILKHIDMFVQYLDEHSEWFGEIFYIADETRPR